MPFSWVRARGNRAYISGHIALNPDGSVAGPLGKVGAEVSAEEGYESARLVALAHLAASSGHSGTSTESQPGYESSPWSTQPPGSTRRRWSPTATRPHPRALRPRSGGARPFLHRNDDTAECPGQLRGGGGDRRLTEERRRLALGHLLVQLRSHHHAFLLVGVGPSPYEDGWPLPTIDRHMGHPRRGK